MNQSLAYKPLMGWHIVNTPKLFLERGQRAVGLTRQLLNGTLREDVVIDNLLETLFCRINTPEHLALQTTILGNGYVVDKLGELKTLDRIVVRLSFVVG